MAVKFTARMVEALKPKTERFDLREAGRHGFGIRVNPGGGKSWIYFYRFDGIRRRMTLGKYPAMSLAAAHEAHGRAERDRMDDIDPGEMKVAKAKAHNEAETVAETIELYMASVSKKKRTIGEDRRIINKDILPVWGRKKANGITKRQVLAVLDRIVNRGAPITANRTLAVIRRIFNWAISRDMLTVNPCAGIEAPGAAVSRDRVLSDDEIRVVWQAIEEQTYPYREFYKLSLLTGQRRGEVSTMRWGDIDMDKAIWTIPAAIAKNGKVHDVPLSETAREILADIPRRSKYVFTTTAGRTNEKGEDMSIAINGFSKAKKLLDMAIEQKAEITLWRVHDMRRTLTTKLAGMGFAPHIVDKILNHVSGTISGVAAVYNRYKYMEERRTALDAWDRRLREIISGETAGNVIRLRGE